MDKKDEKILQILKKNGRASYTDISEKVDVSEATVRNRIEKMRENNVIERFTVKTGRKESKAVVMAKLETGRDIENILDKFPGQIQIKEVTGDYDLIIELERSSNQEINKILDKIREISGVKNTETYMVLQERA
ncbi:MAG: Lrp/AsnC family transcriptional regulator [Candidatus Nanohalobium sp.]